MKAEAVALSFQKWLEPSLLLLLSSSNFVVVNVFLLTLEVLFSKHINEVLLNEYSVCNPKKLREGFYILKQIHKWYILLKL